MNKKHIQSIIITTGLAIFAMLFGAGNLIFPVQLGILAGDKTHIGLIGFIISGVLIPIMGLIGMSLFDGDVKAFFYRMGKIPGALLIFFCMLIIGPLFVMPRIIALSYDLMQPFMPEISRLTFGLIFGLLTFVACYKKNAIVSLLGNILSPIKLLTLFTIIIMGLWYCKPLAVSTQNGWDIFFINFKEGYKTLDLMATIFFAYIIISILRKTLSAEITNNKKTMAKIMLQSGLIGGALLAIVYIGMAYAGAIHGQEFASLGIGEKFIETVRAIIGNNGALFISATILIACLSTMIALGTVVSEYLRIDIFNNKISYTSSLAVVLVLTSIMAKFKLDDLLGFYVPVMDISYPVLIALTVCNIGYKLFGFKPVKTPVYLTFIFMFIWTFYDMFKIKSEVPATIEVKEEIAPFDS